MSLAEIQTAPHARAQRPRYFWTAREEQLLREHYPKGGVPACMPHIPGKTDRAIYQKAHTLGLRKPGYVKDLSYQRYSTSGTIDDVIRRAYLTPSRGFTKRLAKTVNRPAWWVTMRARRLGLVAPRFKEPPWTEAEEHFVCENAHRNPASLQQMMRRRGWSRTATAITVKLRRLGQSTVDPNLYTANGFADLMGVDRKTVLRWIEKGWLTAHRRDDAHDRPGHDDRWAIKRKDARRFIVENVAAIDVRKVEKHWFVDLLAGHKS